MDVRSLLESCGRQAAALNKHCWIFFALLTSYVIKVSILWVMALWDDCIAFSTDQGSYLFLKTVKFRNFSFWIWLKHVQECKIPIWQIQWLAMQNSSGLISVDILDCFLGNHIFLSALLFRHQLCLLIN